MMYLQFNTFFKWLQLDVRGIDSIIIFDDSSLFMVNITQLRKYAYLPKTYTSNGSCLFSTFLVFFHNKTRNMYH